MKRGPTTSLVFSPPEHHAAIAERRCLALAVRNALSRTQVVRSIAGGS